MKHRIPQVILKSGRVRRPRMKLSNRHMALGIRDRVVVYNNTIGQLIGACVELDEGQRDTNDLVMSLLKELP